MEQKYWRCDEIKNLKIHGRTTKKQGVLNLFYTGSGIEINVTGSEAWLTYEADYDVMEPWFAVLIDGAVVTRQMAYKGQNKICLFRGMNPENVKNVRFLKETQAMSNDEKHSLSVVGITTDGDFAPVEEKKYKLEFVGDSITSGEGTIGAKKELDWISMFFTSTNHYAFLTSEKLNADYRIVSQSGWGVLTSWDNDPHCSVPQYYEQVCGLAPGEKNEQAGAHENYDFASWQPDAVIINLGTNDASAFNQPAYTDPVTGEMTKQRCREDGSFLEEDVEKFMQAAINFLSVVRKNNPKAKIVWVYGMLSYEFSGPIYRAILRYQQETGDNGVYFRQLPKATDDTIGSREHPGLKCHELAAGVLSEALLEIL